ncbi:NotI family restriction endonuclease [Hellea sp.]|nr:NotI family restriction endonuclease [Hellea sp.]
MNGVIELYTHKKEEPNIDWRSIGNHQTCPLISRKCLKNRKSEPEQTIGTCVVKHGQKSVLICPHRLLEKNIIFRDSIHLLTKHEPGNEIHILSEIGTSAGNIDYVLASVRKNKVVDFVGIELQTMDTTGTLFPHRERFLKEVGISNLDQDILVSDKPFGINWKMTAKTILVQLHHKIAFFEEFNKTLVLVLQDHLLAYMQSQFKFDHFEAPSLGNSMHFHSYAYQESGNSSLQLVERLSTDAIGINTCLGLNETNKVDLEQFLHKIQSKISKDTLLVI